jgi:hypothetical protein
VAEGQALQFALQHNFRSGARPLGRLVLHGNTGFAISNPFASEHGVRNVEVMSRLAGLARVAMEYRWSSAGGPTGASAADQGVRPTDDRQRD